MNLTRIREALCDIDDAGFVEDATAMGYPDNATLLAELKMTGNIRYTFMGSYSLAHHRHIPHEYLIVFLQGSGWYVENVIAAFEKLGGDRGLEGTGQVREEAHNNTDESTT